jgi:hypothetical protein
MMANNPSKNGKKKKHYECFANTSAMENLSYQN